MYKSLYLMLGDCEKAFNSAPYPHFTYSVCYFNNDFVLPWLCRRGLFSRSSQKEPVQGWKLFGKVPAKDVRDNSSEPHYQASSFDRGNPRWLKLSINYMYLYSFMMHLINLLVVHVCTCKNA